MLNPILMYKLSRLHITLCTISYMLPMYKNEFNLSVVTAEILQFLNIWNKNPPTWIYSPLLWSVYLASASEQPHKTWERQKTVQMHYLSWNDFLRPATLWPLLTPVKLSVILAIRWQEVQHIIIRTKPQAASQEATLHVLH